MPKDPAILWYWNDWQGGTITFTRHLKGCYMDLLHAQFNSGRLSLAQIKTVLGVDFGPAWPLLQEKFKKDDNDRFYNERAESEKERRSKYTESRRKNLHSPHMKQHKEPHMETVIEDENKIDTESENFGKSENLFLIPQMFELFKKTNSQYPGSQEKDYKPLFSIATFFCEVGKLQGSPDHHREKILEVWEPVCQAIAKDKFYKQKSLLTISNHIQEITQNALHGKSNGKPDYGSKERADEYDRLFAERYGEGGSTTG